MGQINENPMIIESLGMNKNEQKTEKSFIPFREVSLEKFYLNRIKILRTLNLLYQDMKLQSFMKN